MVSNHSEEERPVDPDGPPVPRKALLVVLASLAVDAQELLAAAIPPAGEGERRSGPRPGPRTGPRGGPGSTLGARLRAEQRAADTEVSQVSDAALARAENLARARALLTVRRELLALMR